MHRLLRHYSAKMQCRAILVVGLFTLASGLKVDDLKKDPAGPGQPEATMDAACAECAKSAPYLDTGDDCVCHATDIMRTFENDATKKLTTRSKYGFKTEQTGVAKLASGWMWHCRPISATPGVWHQC